MYYCHTHSNTVEGDQFIMIRLLYYTHTHHSYDMMRQCWAYSSEDRPHFATVQEQLDGLAHSKMVHIHCHSAYTTHLVYIYAAEYTDQELMISGHNSVTFFPFLFAEFVGLETLQ